MNQEQKVEKLILYYRLYDEKKWKVILRYLSAVLDRDRHQAILLYKEIIALYEKNKFKKEIAGGMVIPTLAELSRKKYDNKKLRQETISKYLGSLVNGMRRVVAVDYTLNNPSLIEFCYVNNLKKQEGFSLYFSELSKINSASNSESEINLYAQYALKRDLYFHPLFDKHNDQALELLNNAAGDIKKLYYTEVFKFHLQNIEQRQATGRDIDHIFPVAETLKGVQSLSNDINVELYYRIITWAKSDGQPPNQLIRISETFRKKLKDLSKSDGAYLYTLLTNHLIRMNREGHGECLKEIAVLNDDIIETDIILVNGAIPCDHFINIILIKCDVNLAFESPIDESTLINFVSKYIHKVVEHKRGFAKALTEKHIYLKFKQYHKASNIGLPGEFPSIADELRYRCLDLCCLYKGNNNKLFSNGCRDFSKFIEKIESKLNEKQIKGNRHFLKKIQDLSRLKKRLNQAEGEPKKIQKLKNEIQNFRLSIDEMEEFIVMKNWLLQECEELIKPL